MAEKSYVVTAACAVVYNSDRSAAVTVAKGGAVPPGVDPEHLRLLVDRGMVEEREFTGGLDVDPDVAPPFRPDPAESRRQTSSYDGTAPPAKSASKADWVDWATRVEGGNPEKVASLQELTRDQLVENYGDKTLAPAST